MQALILQTESQEPSWVLGPVHKLPEVSRKGRKRTQARQCSRPWEQGVQYDACVIHAYPIVYPMPIHGLARVPS